MKHETICPAPGRTTSFVKSSAKRDNNQEKETVKKQASLTDMISRDQAMKAEFFWAREVPKCKYS